MNRLLLALMAFSGIAHASVTLTIPAPVSTPPIGAYAQVNLVNCTNPTILNSSVSVPVTRSFYFNGQPSVTATIPDNVSQIVCNGNQLSYYTVNYVSFGVTTYIKSVELPMGIFNIANLAEVVAPPFNSGVISGPVGPVGPAGPTGVDTGNGTNGGFNVPGVFATTMAQFNIVNPPLNSIGIRTNYTQDFTPSYAGAPFTNDVNTTVINVDAPSYSSNFGDAWTVWHANSIQANFFEAGIAQEHYDTIGHYGMGDTAGHYIYMFLRGGTTAPADEGWDGVLTGNSTELGNPITSTVTTGGTGATTVKLACGSSCAQPGVGQYLTERNVTPAISYATAISTNQAGCSSCVPSTITTPETLPVSDAWGTQVATVTPPNPTDPTNPASWATSTFAINVLHGTFTAGMWACAGSGRYERFQILTATSLSGGQQTLTAKLTHTQFAPGDGPGGFDNGWIMADTAGLCATTNGIDFVANRIGSMHYVQPVLGATDSHSIRLQSNFQGYTQSFMPGNVSLVATTSVSITRAGNLVKFIPNFDPKANGQFSHVSLTITGATNSSLNGLCTNSYIFNYQTIACTQTGADIPTPDTTGKVSIGTNGYGNSDYERVSINEIYDVRDTSQATASTNYTTIPPTFVQSAMLNGTFHLAPNPGRWTTGETVSMYNHYLFSGHALNTNSIINNPLTSNTSSWEDYASGGAVGPNWNMLHIQNQNQFSMYAGHGGVVRAPTGIRISGPHFNSITSDSTPTLNGTFLNMGCPPLGCDDPTYTGYYAWQFPTNGGGLREFLDVFNAAASMSVTGTAGGVSDNSSAGALGVYRTFGVGDSGGSSIITQTSTALTFNKPFTALTLSSTNADNFPAGTTIGTKNICLQDGTNCATAAVAQGTVILVSGVATVSTTSACTAGSACVYNLTNCGVLGSTSLGVLTTTTITPGTSFNIQSATVGTTPAVQTGDASRVCWKIN